MRFNIRRIGAGAIVAALGIGLAGCAASQPSVPMALACGPDQRAVMRQVVINGAPQAQLQCESIAVPAATSGIAAVPVADAPSVVPVGYAPSPIADARFVRTAYEPAVVTRPVAPRRFVSSRAPLRAARPQRSVKKSLAIIGSSAGVGAGVGAAIGGKKGAGIGALIGGGGAALWDQLTRR